MKPVEIADRQCEPTVIGKPGGEVANQLHARALGWTLRLSKKSKGDFSRGCTRMDADKDRSMQE